MVGLIWVDCACKVTGQHEPGSLPCIRDKDFFPDLMLMLCSRLNIIRNRRKLRCIDISYVTYSTRRLGCCCKYWSMCFPGSTKEAHWRARDLSYYLRYAFDACIGKLMCGYVPVYENEVTRHGPRSLGARALVYLVFQRSSLCTTILPGIA
jgi:hypothetical protein